MNMNIQKYLDQIKALEKETSFTRAMEEFLNTYDGTNEKELENLALNYIMLILVTEDLKIKAKGYDLVDTHNKTFKNQMDVLKENFKDIDEAHSELDPPVEL